ncbi:MAG: 3-hexulose-6-phosphate synthase [Candidatus Asgardarchaeia archaeon]
MLRKVYLQVALDLVDLEEALKISKLASEGGADWIEVGTPLIKSEGKRAIREIRKIFPDKTIVADMKVADVGSLEVEIAASAGADIISVLAVADDSTIKSALEAAEELGVKISVDMINCKNLKERVKVLEEMGVDIIEVHVGIDQQRMGLTPFDALKEIRPLVKIPVAIAGGINEKTAPLARDLGADIVIVGKAITGSPDPREATMRIKRALSS